MKICVPICNRTNYSKLRPILSLMKDEVEILASSSLILERHGNAIVDIEDDGFDIAAKVDCLMANDRPSSTIKTLSISMIEHSCVLERSKFDAMLVVGDRYDMLAPVLSANFMGLPILHIQGGERTGCVDDAVRDIITVCSEEHYVSTESSANRVKNIVEHNKVFNVGCPAVEAVSKVDVGEKLYTNCFKKQYKNPINILPDEDYFLLSVHPNSLIKEDIDMEKIIRSCIGFNKKCVVFYPNIDAYNSNILQNINKHRDSLILIKHAPFEDFVKLMAHARCFIGNSSSGIREAACFGTPVVNIGMRQSFRERNANVIDVDCVEQHICAAIEKSLDVIRYEKDNIYYKPNSSLKIVDLIRTFKDRL